MMPMRGALTLGATAQELVEALVMQLAERKVSQRAYPAVLLLAKKYLNLTVLTWMSGILAGTQRLAPSLSLLQ